MQSQKKYNNKKRLDLTGKKLKNNEIEKKNNCENHLKLKTILNLVDYSKLKKCNKENKDEIEKTT